MKIRSLILNPFDKTIKLIFLLLLASFAFYNVVNNKHELVDLTYMLTCIFVALTNLRFPNIVVLVSILFLFKTLELLVFSQFYEVFNGYTLYSLYILIDLFLMTGIYLRVPVTRGIFYANKIYFDEQKWFTTKSDNMFSIVQLFHVTLGILMLLEHALRHIDDFFLDIVLQLFIEKSQIANITHWLYLNARVIYNSFPTLEMIITSFEFIVIISANSINEKEINHNHMPPIELLQP